ncbi:putative phosphoglycerate mutase [Streptoalloteichus tenebrarius]|uniref:Phosphoglycerate mutase n=1 Tax=Streptoalloteichus tenebrarius (strain ATCC 17920 / DSM 40477 / JCM 4838 / CBS 697.72 / NBRC 16177 / NCIMB 11028 / NRRL B-12390 / A12253. 1 / ISP 5477) TaxID=1933 RepID=A0ABT1HTA5_STRSD|nr:acid phosphatase [Streptoalloteichus tenebrarius]MCP2258713.1 putative phosphoglycerate mutase [Streptoalloteichus tenebrarius]BFF02861.1 acid phosphatase [Streptoalloteichus tenebrarius]
MGADREPAVYLIRHGETEWSATGKHTSYSDVPLTDNGERVARAAGAILTRLRGTDERPALVLSSPRQRALRTAELAGLAPDEVTEELAEWNYGEYEGLTTPEIRQTVAGWTVWTHPVPGGEDPGQVTDRADAVLTRARAALDQGDVVLVGHGHFSRVLTARWIGLPATAGVHFGLEAAGIGVLGHERGVPQIGRMNVPPWELV